MSGVTSVTVKADSGQLLDSLRFRRTTYLTSIAAVVTSRFVSRAVSLLLLVAAARFITVGAFGVYSYFVSLALTFSVLANLGIAPVVARQVAAGTWGARDALRSAMPITIGAFAVLGGAVSAIAWATAPAGGSGWDALAVGAFVLVTGPFDLNGALLRAVGRLQWEAATQLVSAAAFAAIALPIMIFRPSVLALILAFSAKEAVGLAASSVLLRRALPRADSLIRIPRGLLVRRGVVVAASAVTVAILLRVPLQILANVGSREQTAYFSVSARLADLWLLVGTAAGLAIFPFVARQREAHVAPHPGRRELSLCAAASVAVALCAGLLMGPAVRFVFGASYQPAVEGARIVAFCAPVFVLASVLRQVLVAVGQEGRALRAHGIAVCALVPLGAVAIPTWHVLGAVVTSTVGFGLLTAALLFSWRSPA